MKEERQIFNLEFFCSSGKYIPFWINEDDFVLLIRENKLIPAITGNNNLLIPKYTLELLFKRVVKRQLGCNVTIVENGDKWMQQEWKPNTTRTIKCCRYMLYNLTKGTIIAIENNEDSQKLDIMLKEADCTTMFMDKIYNLIETTRYISNLYRKYNTFR